MAYETFPTISGGSITEGSYEIEDPIVETGMENGWTDVRTTRSRARFVNIKVTFVVNATDNATVLGFLVSKRLRTIPFFYRHDKLGTLLVRLSTPTLPVAFEILGDPVWYRLELTFEEQF
jgi:hypothetical protein